MTRYVYACRAGFEPDLIEELARAKVTARAHAAWVECDAAAKTWPTFARVGFEVGAEVAPTVDALTDAVIATLVRVFAGKPKAWALQAWVPDHDSTNVLSAKAEALGGATASSVGTARPDLGLRKVERAEEARNLAGVLVQIVLVAPDRALVGTIAAVDAPTLAAGGRARAGNSKDAPSRAGRKLTEALEWIGRSPEPGEVCVDLGAAPGGWSAVLLDLRARVIAVDPAKLAPDIARKKGLTHVQRSAFDFVPSEPVDWLFCDMAWRPVEVAQMLAKWGRRRLAQTLVANVKLPMKQRAEFAAKVIEIVKAGGWRDVRGRQLYHDREEITLAAWRT